MNTLNKSAGMTTPIAHIAAHSIFMQKRIRAAMAAAENPEKVKYVVKTKSYPPPPPPPRIIREVAELVKRRLSVQ